MDRPHKVYPQLDITDYTTKGKPISADNAEAATRSIMAEFSDFLKIDPEKLSLTKIRKAKLGFWNISYQQMHAGLPVYAEILT